METDEIILGVGRAEKLSYFKKMTDWEIWIQLYLLPGRCYFQGGLIFIILDRKLYFPYLMLN